MAFLANHLEQISLSAKSISELELPPPKIFTNALLNNQEITTLIRDTEPHERALFSIDPNALSRNRQQNGFPPMDTKNGHQGRKSGFPSAHPIKQSAVSRLLGKEMLQEIRQSSSARSREGVNVEVLLRGAEKLCEVYTVAGATDRIRVLRSRHREVAGSIAMLEEKVSKQQSLLDRRNLALNSEEREDEQEQDQDPMDHNDAVGFLEEDFQVEEEEIRELEARKKALEERVSDMERDLGGLLK
ncbi:uncharacterized protein Z519_09991 [Cladophialophora bantiana CBS 173.52]|uniref:DASH complex subunit SPC34 n=1 Tax=Cladophialophora bantiana (strain ATCC 10958 / CBS 173.52 / CDC B-1940 / NIH 8579) TaxID=1442370 RepID=A0A0D2HX36_CLAB1|nr:uncharacterized protein Z519_09991 [Cladophialophora bantiana CBS 173.52]KIW89139.1 hypothetical protein Z519_09991 [Cladophialophora bantiana CBS 173.52]